MTALAIGESASKASGSARRTTEKPRRNGNGQAKFGTITDAVRKRVGRFIGNFFLLPVRYRWTANLKRLRSYRERTPWPFSGIL
jgi:hypothetical protein